MTKAAHFEAKKHAYRQTQDGIVISFVVHPNDVSAELATAPLGTRYMVAFAQIGDDDQPVNAEPKKPEEKARKPFHEMSRAQQAGILCADPQFQSWLAAPEAGSEEDAANYVRYHCGVKSRSQLDMGSASAKWDELVEAYRITTGQQTEMRG